jgi:hypothetical protein
MPDKLQLQLDYMLSNSLAFSWSYYDVVDDNDMYIRTQISPENCTYRDLLTKRAVIGCLTAVYDRNLLGVQFMPTIRMRQDFGLWLRLLRVAEERGLKVRGLACSLGKYRVHEAAMTRNKIRAAWYQWRLYRDVERLSFMKSAYCFGSYTLRGVTDRLLAAKE